MSALRARGVVFRDAGDLGARWANRPPADLTPGLALLQDFITSDAPPMVRGEVAMWLDNPTARSVDEWLIECLEQRRLDGYPAQRVAELAGRRALHAKNLHRFIALASDRSQPIDVRSVLLHSITKGRRRDDVRQLVIDAVSDPRLAYQTLPVVARLGLVVPVELLRAHLEHPEKDIRRLAEKLLRDR